MIDQNQKIPSQNYFHENDGELILTNLDLEIAVANIDQYPNEEYALLRKNGLGGSDSAAVLGVSPFTSRNELIAEKCRPYLTAEEKAIGDKITVRKGRDLEPMIIQQFEKTFKVPTIKPVHMYRHKEFPFITINFDGVVNTPDQYVPAEIKVVTAYGEKHYDPQKALYGELFGFRPIPVDPVGRNWSIETRAAYYGIPPYYYTQLQQEIFCLKAPYGFLSVIFDKDWRYYTFFIWRDEDVINNLVIEGYKVWEQIEARRGLNWQLKKDGLGLTSMEP